MAYQSLYSHADFLYSRDNFVKSGGHVSDDFNKFDTPGHKYFKILFYFCNGDSEGVSAGNLGPNQKNVIGNTGLLAPTWLIPESEMGDLYHYESAWAYLVRNCEDERAELLKEFVSLLSNINTRSPWYFSEITGLDTAIERKIMEGNLQFEEKRPKISIKCLQDSYDERISTLLDLYRTIVFSWTKKCEILPANLRKFDMGILVFETPNTPFHVFSNSLTDRGGFVPASDLYMGPHKSTEDHEFKTSWKYYELHNCEIDYNSSKTIVSNLNNKEGFNPECTIDIHFDDCYEIRYNEFLLREIGDVIVNDIKSWDNGLPDQTSNYFEEPEPPAPPAVEPDPNRPPPPNRANYSEGFTGDYYYNQDLKKYNEKYNIRQPEPPKPKLLDSRIDYQYQKQDYYFNDTDYETRPDPYSHYGGEFELISSMLTEKDKKVIEEEKKKNDPKQSSNKKSNKFTDALINAGAQVAGTAYRFVSSKLKRALLGNLYTFSLTRLGDQLKAAANGDVWSTLRAVDEYNRDAKQRRGQVGFTDDNIFDNKPPRIIPSVKRMGNITKGKSIANNI